MKLFDGIRELNWDFWKSYFHDPDTHRALAKAVLVIFVADLLYTILVPKKVRDERARRDNTA